MEPKHQLIGATVKARWMQAIIPLFVSLSNFVADYISITYMINSVTQRFKDVCTIIQLVFAIVGCCRLLRRSKKSKVSYIFEFGKIQNINI